MSNQYSAPAIGTAQPVFEIDPATGLERSSSNPLPTNDQVAAMILAGKAFVASTGKQTSTGNFTEGLSVFNPANSGKTLYFFSAKTGTGNTAWHGLYAGIAADPALGSSLTPNNEFGGGAASVASASYTNAAASITPAGTLHEEIQVAGGWTTEFLDIDEMIICPPGYGVEIAVVTATNAWVATLKWWEQ